MISVLSVCFCALLLIQVLNAEEGPLERLRNRSAEKRWKTIRERIADRRESRRERVENRKATAENPPQSQEEKADSKRTKKTGEKSHKSQPSRMTAKQSAAAHAQRKKSNLPAVTPFAADQPIYFEQFQFEKKKHHPRKKKNGHLAGKKSHSKQPSSADAIELPLPVIHPAPFPTPEQVNDFPAVTPLPVSQSKEYSNTKNVTTAFAPEIKLPGFKPEVPNRNSKTPEEVENELKSQSLGSEYDEIKPIQSISPFVDYEPDKKLRAEDPGRHLCFPDAVRPDLVSNADVQCPGIESLPGSEISLSRNFAHLNYTWKASNVHSYPLYFEDPNLERYGHIRRPLVQPIASITRFNIQLLGLPYQMTMQPVCKCVYPLGHFRPGDACAPKYLYQIPLNPWAALITAEVYTGLFFLIP